MMGHANKVVLVAFSLMWGCSSNAVVDGVPADGGAGGNGGQAGGGGAGAGGGGGGGGDSCSDVLVSFTMTDLGHIVPAEVSFVHAKAWGSGGNQECTNDSGRGGLGGFTEAIFAVNPGSPLIVIIGDRKLTAPLTAAEQVSFGFPGQGAGGLSGLFEGSAPLTQTDAARALIIAGGGAGAGALGPNCSHGHPGNHPGAGGQLTMLGEDGSIQINSGGGGYKGGDGGATDIDPGLGGEGYVKATALSSNMDWGEAGELTAPGALDDDYDGEAGMQEKPGLMVLHYLCNEPPPL